MRYYIQRGLLAAPHGAGRGSYYDASHLSQLIALREAQQAGVSLSELAELSQASPPPSLEVHQEHTHGTQPNHTQALNQALNQAPHQTLISPERLAYAQLERWLRVPCADGVELNVRSGALSPEQLNTLIQLIKSAL